MVVSEPNRKLEYGNYKQIYGENLKARCKITHCFKNERRFYWKKIGGESANYGLKEGIYSGRSD